MSRPVDIPFRADPSFRHTKTRIYSKLRRALELIEESEELMSPYRNFFEGPIQDLAEAKDRLCINEQLQDMFLK